MNTGNFFKYVEECGFYILKIPLVKCECSYCSNTIKCHWLRDNTYISTDIDLHIKFSVGVLHIATLILILMNTWQICRYLLKILLSNKWEIWLILVQLYLYTSRNNEKAQVINEFRVMRFRWFMHRWFSLSKTNDHCQYSVLNAFNSKGSMKTKKYFHKWFKSDSYCFSPRSFFLFTLIIFVYLMFHVRQFSHKICRKLR